MPAVKKVNIADIQAQPGQTYWQYFINVSTRLLDAYGDNKSDTDFIVGLITSGRITDPECLRTHVFAVPAEDDEQISKRISSAFEVLTLTGYGLDYKNTVASSSPTVDVQDLVRLFEKRAHAEEEMALQADKFRDNFSTLNAKIKKTGFVGEPLTTDRKKLFIANVFFENITASYKTQIAVTFGVIRTLLIRSESSYHKLNNCLDNNDLTGMYNYLLEHQASREAIDHFFSEYKVTSKAGPRELYAGLHLPYDVNQFLLDWVKHKCALELGTLSARASDKGQNPSVMTRMYDNAIHFFSESSDNFSNRMKVRKEKIRDCIKTLSASKTLNEVREALNNLSDSNRARENGFSKTLDAKINGHNGLLPRIQALETVQEDLVLHVAGPRLPRQVR